jgi:hypothetical protein
MQNVAHPSTLAHFHLRSAESGGVAQLVKSRLQTVSRDSYKSPGKISKSWPHTDWHDFMDTLPVSKSNDVGIFPPKDLLVVRPR